MAEQGIVYHVRAILEAKRGAGSSKQMEKFAAGLVKAGEKMSGVGDKLIGNTFQMAAGFGKVAVMAGVAAGAAGMGAMVQQSLKFNNQLEVMKYGMASTLQLMGHSSGDFARNLDVSQAAMDRLFDIASKSPATFEQTSQMFSNMLPGARSVTDNMEDILGLTKESLALGMIMGGDFATTGAQMSRILTGGAGAEFETWKVLQKPILDAGKAAGYFNDSMVMGTKLTEQFNRLAPDQRYELVRKATEKLGVATDAYAGTWAGLTSAMESDLQIIQKEIGKVAFANLKDSFKRMTAGGGVLDPNGETMKKLLKFAAFLGEILGRAATKLANGFEWFVRNFADNWEHYVQRAMTFADGLWRAAKVLAKIKIAAAGAGVGAKVMGGAMTAAGKALEGLQQLWPYLSKLGVWGFALIPVIAAVGFALIGVGAIFAGIAAAIATRWQEIVETIQSGAVSFEPFFNAVDHLWAKLVALGNAMIGNAKGADMAQWAVNTLTWMVEGLTGAMSAGLRVLGAFQFAYNAVTAGVRTIYLGLTSMVYGVLSVLKAALDYIPGAEGAAASVGSAMNTVYAESKSTLSAIQKDASEATSLFAKADVFDAAFAQSDQGVTKGLRDLLGSWVAPVEAQLDSGSLLAGTQMAGGVKSKGPGGATTHIHKMVVNQDLRNQDPDRVIGAFYKAVDKSIRNRTQSLAQAEQGV